MARVGIDLDGVCYDFTRAIAECHTGPDNPYPNEKFPEAKRWEFYLDWGWSLAEFVAHCDKAVDQGYLFRMGEPLNDAREQLERLREQGHKIVLITDRSFGERSEVNTYEWLEDYEIPFDEIYFTADKASIPVDWHIDDKVENIEAMLAAGVRAILHDRPWNQHGPSKWLRVSELKQFVDRVLTSESRGIPITALDGTFVADIPQAPFPIHDPGEVRSVSSTGAEKGTKLARFDLIPVEPLRLLAEHYGRGAQKYADRNWEKGYEWSKSFAALNRHLWAFWSGEDIDPETGSPHLTAVMWHAAAMLEYSRTHPEFDDRPGSMV